MSCVPLIPVHRTYILTLKCHQIKFSFFFLVYFQSTKDEDEDIDELVKSHRSSGLLTPHGVSIHIGINVQSFQVSSCDVFSQKWNHSIDFCLQLSMSQHLIFCTIYWHHVPSNDNVEEKKVAVCLSVCLNISNALKILPQERILAKSWILLTRFPNVMKVLFLYPDCLYACFLASLNVLLKKAIPL
jgi:hypothetical protein